MKGVPEHSAERSPERVNKGGMGFTAGTIAKKKKG